MKIGFFELEGWEEKLLKEEFSRDELTFSSEKIDEENIPSETGFEILSVFIDSKINRTVLDRFPHLKFISTRSTGFEHIELEECGIRKIPVSFVPGYA